MERKTIVVKSDLDKARDEFMRANADIFYKLTSQEIGSRVHEAPEEERHTSDGSFTRHLAAAGMYRFSGLNTTTDKERVIDGSKDWMLNL
jgi:hypothetical protein